MVLFTCTYNVIINVKKHIYYHIYENNISVIHAVLKSN